MLVSSLTGSSEHFRAKEPLDMLGVEPGARPGEGGDAYGTEVDLLASRTFECGVVGGLKLASYSADEFSEDTTKAWFWLGYSF